MRQSVASGVSPWDKLATYTYRVFPDAGGVFVIDVLRDEGNQDQTFLVASPSGKIDVTQTMPAVFVVMVESASVAE